MEKQITVSSILLLSQLLLLSLFAISSMAADSSSSDAKVHIVYTEKPEGVEPEQYHIKTLASVLGSEDAAKDALINSYKHAASGFAAKLNPQQVSELSKQARVLQDDQLAIDACNQLVHVGVQSPICNDIS